MKNSKTKKKSGVGNAIAALALSAIMLAGGCAVGYGAGTHWTYKRNGTQATVPDNGGSEISNEQNSVLLTADKTDGAKFNIRALKASEYRENDIDSQSVESAYTATVTLANHNEATDKSISLTAEFADGQSASEYISFSAATVQSGEQFTISCTQAFGQAITIKATANGVQEGTKPSCSIKADYVCRIESVIFGLGNAGDHDDENVFHVDLSKNYSSYSQSAIATNLSAALDDTDYNLSCLYTDEYSVGTIKEKITNVKLALCPESSSKPTQWTYEQTHDGNIIFNSYDYCMQSIVRNNDSANWFDNFGSTLLQNAGGSYGSAKDAYLENRITSRLWVEFTGETSGITYTFSGGIIADPQFDYVSAQSPAFDGNTSGGIAF